MLRGKTTPVLTGLTHLSRMDYPNLISRMSQFPNLGVLGGIFFNFFPNFNIVQALISVHALVFDLAQLSCQKRFDCRNAILRTSAMLLGTSYSQIVVAVLL